MNGSLLKAHGGARFVEKEIPRSQIDGISSRRNLLKSPSRICSSDSTNLQVVMAKKPLGTTGEFFRRRDEWRKHPMLSNQLRHATPGLGIALVAFGIYLVGEQVYNRFYLPSSSSHSHHSSSSTSATH